MKYLSILLSFVILAGAGCLLPPISNSSQQTVDTEVDPYLEGIELASPENFVADGVEIIYDQNGEILALSSDGGNITVTNLVPGEMIEDNFVILGEARVFENSLNYRVSNQAGQLVYTGFTTADSPDVGQFGSYEIVLDMSQEQSGSYLIEVYSDSAMDGSEINMVAFYMIR
jgi:hypothetical protein